MKTQHVCLQMISVALKELNNVHGVYLFVDEYDSFANGYLGPYDAAKRLLKSGLLRCWQDIQRFLVDD